jgi:hypothetical protein
LTSHAIFNYRAYTQQVDQIVFYKSLSFSICDVVSRGMLPTPRALRPNTCNNYSEANLTKVGFENGGHCFAKITSLSHSCYFGTSTTNNLLIILLLHVHDISQDVSIHFSMVLRSRTSFRNWKPLQFGLFCHQSMHLF